MARLNPASEARLRTAMRPHRITQQELAGFLGVSRSTMLRILDGTADLPARFEPFVTTRLGMSLDDILHGDRAGAEPDTVEVPIYDIEVAAGIGRVPLAEQRPVGQWLFPAEWMQRTFGSGAGLQIVRVAGDSQVPELRDGDLVMIDATDQRLRDGMTVVRLDDALLVKRVQVQGATVLLKSANPAYEDIVVDLARDGEAHGAAFAVIGRAVWASKLL